MKLTRLIKTIVLSKGKAKEFEASNILPFSTSLPSSHYDIRYWGTFENEDHRRVIKNMLEESEAFYNFNRFEEVA